MTQSRDSGDARCPQGALPAAAVKVKVKSDPWGRAVRPVGVWFSLVTACTSCFSSDGGSFPSS